MSQRCRSDPSGWKWPQQAGVAIGLMLFFAAVAWAQTTAFTYQGKLTDSGNPANGNFDLQFALFDSPMVGAGVQQGAVVVRNPVAVSAGIFTVTLDFGIAVFSGADRYLEIGVRPAGSGIAYAVLAPRQPITSSPYAIQTLNAQQLGGLPASRYVASDTGGNVGIGTAAPQAKFHVNGSSWFQGDTTPLPAAAGKGIAVGFSGEQGYISGFDYGTFTPKNLLLNLSGGNVGVGTISPVNARLHVDGGGANGVYGKSTGNRGVWGESGSYQGVFGKSNSNAGVVGEANSFHGVYGVSHSVNNAGVYGTNDANGFGVAGVSTGGKGVDGLSTTSTGVAGKSTSGSGVYGESAAASLTAGGVYGKGTGSGSIGVIGEADVDNATGVFGVSTSPAGFGVYARNLAGGRALYVQGNAAQDVESNGLVKAMMEINESGYIVKCYNGIANSYSGNCGFVVTAPLEGVSRINFGFSIASRFASVTARYRSNLYFQNTFNNAGANYRMFDSTSIEVFTFAAGNSRDTQFNGFTIILF